MMNQKILTFLKSFSFQEEKINKLIVSTFLYTNNIKNVENEFISNLIIENSSEDYESVLKFSSLFEKALDIEALLMLFEFVISPKDREVNGAIYTPKYIRDFIVKNAFEKAIYEGNNLESALIADISCGCGGFFKTATEEIKKNHNKSFYDIYKENIYGIDIQEYSIIRTKILLTLFAIINMEDRKEFQFNLFIGDSLEFNWNDIEAVHNNGGFNLIIGNPPYVGSTKIEKSTREFLHNWSVTSTGKPDLYIPFFQIAIENLSELGVLGYITVNTFQKSLNARALRNYFSNMNYDFKIIDFGGEQVFKSRSTYTCICILTKKVEQCIYYTKVNSKNLSKIKAKDFIKIKYEDVDDYNGWHLVDFKTNIEIKKIENTGKKLGQLFEIRNGFATLKNKIYIFTPLKEDDDYYYFVKNDIEYKVERDICKDTIKPNTLKSEEDLTASLEKIIFPYLFNRTFDIFDNEKREIRILEENILKEQFPFAYKYLLLHKRELFERDKGNKEYEKWYAFGRNQALNLKGYKLFLPYISSSPCFVFCDDLDLLFYNGYAILSENAYNLRVIQKILMSSIFWFYIKNTSRPYSGDFYSVAKNYIKNFGICDLTNKEKSNLLKLTDKYEIDKFLCAKYKIDYDIL